MTRTRTVRSSPSEGLRPRAARSSGAWRVVAGRGGWDQAAITSRHAAPVICRAGSAPSPQPTSDDRIDAIARTQFGQIMDLAGEESRVLHRRSPARAGCRNFKRAGFYPPRRAPARLAAKGVVRCQATGSRGVGSPTSTPKSMRTGASKPLPLGARASDPSRSSTPMSSFQIRTSLDWALGS